MAVKAMNFKMEESKEILSEIEDLTDDDLTITSAKRFTV